jgi:hypothetical protein
VIPTEQVQLLFEVAGRNGHRVRADRAKPVTHKNWNGRLCGVQKNGWECNAEDDSDQTAQKRCMSRDV